MSTDYVDETGAAGEQDTGLVRQLRKQLTAANQKADAAQQELRGYRFKEAGFDPEKGVGRLFASQYDGDMTVDAIREAADELGLDVAAPGDSRDGDKAPPVPPERSERQQAQDRLAQLRQSGTTGADERVDHKQFLELLRTDPEQARALHDAGKVAYPPQMSPHRPVNA